jgi:hypothetical protein
MAPNRNGMANWYLMAEALYFGKAAPFGKGIDGFR